MTFLYTLCSFLNSNKQFIKIKSNLTRPSEHYNECTHTQFRFSYVISFQLQHHYNRMINFIRSLLGRLYLVKQLTSYLVLGTFTLSRKARIGFVISVRHYVRQSECVSANPNGRISTKFYTEVYLKYIPVKTQLYSINYTCIRL